MAFTLAAFCYIVALILSFHLLLLAFSQVIAFEELKSEKNPIVLCKKLNPLVVPEYVAHAGLTLLFLCSGRWHTFLLNVPLVVYHVFRYKNRPVVPSPGLYDPNTIMNPRDLNYAYKEGIFKLVFYLVSIFYYLFDCVLAIVLVLLLPAATCLTGFVLLLIIDSPSNNNSITFL